MDIDAFFKEVGIDEYSIVRIEDLPDTDRSGPLHLVSSARSVIVFGMEIPVPVYEAPTREKTQKMLQIVESLDRTAARLADRLIAENFRSAVVPLFLPLRVEFGEIQGIVRLKRIAALGGLGTIGTIGKSKLLISPRHGTRLAFSGIVTEMEAGLLKTSLAADFYGNCGRCVRAGQSVPMGSMSSGAGISVHGSRPRWSRQRPGC